MRRAQLEAALIEAGRVAGLDELLLVDSQSVFAHTQEPPMEVLISEECDVMSRNGSERLAILEPVLGKQSAYHNATGVFVDAVQPDLVLLANGWQSRLKAMPVGDIMVWCLDINDLVLSKLNAGRLKDYEFINAMLRTKLAQFEEVVRRIQSFPDPHQQALLLARLRISAEAIP
jgi:hypothetical protein